jgi:hypothetical protein
MSYRSMVLLMSAFALIPVASLAQPASQAAPPNQVMSRAPSNSVLDVSIEEIAATMGGCAVLDKDFPGLRAHAMYHVFKTMSLRRIAAMSHGRITTAMLAQARTDLSALPIEVAARSADQPDPVDLVFDSPGGQDLRRVSAPK